MNQETYGTENTAPEKGRRSGGGKLVGIILVIIGGAYVTKYFIPWIHMGIVWAILAILLGAFLLTRK